MNTVYVRYTTQNIIWKIVGCLPVFLFLIQKYSSQGNFVFTCNAMSVLDLSALNWLREKNCPRYSPLQLNYTHTWLSRRGERRGVGREVWLVQMIVWEGGDGGRAGEGQRHPRAGRHCRGGERTPGFGRSTAGGVVDVMVVGAQVGQCADLVAQDPRTNHSGHQYKHALALEWHPTLQRTSAGNSKQIFPEKGNARPQSQFPHSCVCERFMYIFPQSICLFCYRK